MHKAGEGCVRKRVGERGGGERERESVIETLREMGRSGC